MHEYLYESNRNYGELCTKTYIKAIENMMNYTRRPIWKAIETMVNYAYMKDYGEYERKQSKLW